MPSYKNAEFMEHQMLLCDSKLDNLFQQQNNSYLLKLKIRQIKAFYQHAFNKTEDQEAGIAIVNQYEEFIVTASEVQLGQITAEQAYEKIKNSTEERQANILIQNILKVCELLFWVAAAAISYVACLSIGIHLLLLDPLLGVAVSAGTFILFLLSVDGAGNCFEEFKTFDRINNEHERECSVISFFSTNAPKKKTIEQLSSGSQEEFNSENEHQCAFN